MGNHHCHANDCQTATSPRLLMCQKHWSHVPKAMQLKVLSTFKARSTAPGADPQSWATYYEACADAVEHVARMEGKSAENSYRRMVPKFLAHIKSSDVKTYTKITFADDLYCICEPKNVPDLTDGVDGYTLTDVQMTQAEFNALPEFEG